MSHSSEKKLLLPVFLTVFIDLLGATIVLPILAPLFLDLTTWHHASKYFERCLIQRLK
jgi:hypothetical protein